jgi:hypothetical protein
VTTGTLTTLGVAMRIRPRRSWALEAVLAHILEEVRHPGAQGLVVIAAGRMLEAEAVETEIGIEARQM